MTRSYNYKGNLTDTDLIYYYHIMDLNCYTKKICTTQNLPNSTVHGRLNAAFLVHLVFSNEKACQLTLLSLHVAIS